MRGQRRAGRRTARAGGPPGAAGRRRKVDVSGQSRLLERAEDVAGPRPRLAVTQRGGAGEMDREDGDRENGQGAEHDPGPQPRVRRAAAPRLTTAPASTRKASAAAGACHVHSTAAPARKAAQPAVAAATQAGPAQGRHVAPRRRARRRRIRAAAGAPRARSRRRSRSTASARCGRTRSSAGCAATRTRTPPGRCRAAAHCAPRRRRPPSTDSGPSRERSQAARHVLLAGLLRPERVLEFVPAVGELA